MIDMTPEDFLSHVRGNDQDFGNRPDGHDRSNAMPGSAYDQALDGLNEALAKARAGDHDTEEPEPRRPIQDLPVREPGAYKLDLPDLVDPNDPKLGWFKRQAAEMGLSNKTAQNILDRYLKGQGEEYERAKQDFNKQLSPEWGQNFDRNVRDCNRAITLTDQAISERFGSKLKGGFTRWVKSHPAVGSSPWFARLMLMISDNTR